MSRHTAPVRSGQHRASIYKEITDKIIIEREAGRIPWVQPSEMASATPPIAMPRNASTHRRYSGINVLILWGAVFAQSFTDQNWLSFRQVLGLGGNVDPVWWTPRSFHQRC